MSPETLRCLSVIRAGDLSDFGLLVASAVLLVIAIVGVAVMS